MFHLQNIFEDANPINTQVIWKEETKALPLEKARTMYSKYQKSRTMALHESGTHMLRRCSWKRWILHNSTAPTGRSWIKWSAYTWGLQNQSTLATIRPTCIYCAWSTWDHLRWIGSKPMDEWYARSVMCIITFWCYVGETHKLLWGTW